MIGGTAAVRRICLAALALCLAAGCTRPPPPPVVSPYPSARSLIVLPLLNHSGSSDFDTIRTTDILVEELSQVKGAGLVVLPTNRAMKILLAHGQTHAVTVEQALDVASQLGVDGALVGAVTTYNPYDPPRVGMVLQLYWVRADMKGQVTEPVRLSRSPSGEGPAYYGGAGPASQAQAMLDASDNVVTFRVREYAKQHEGQDSPFGWRRYLVDSDAYMRFVCHELVTDLMDQELRRITVPVVVERP
jgi:hypothetical protein